MLPGPKEKSNNCSELSMEDTVQRGVHGALSYEFRAGLDFNKEVNGNL